MKNRDILKFETILHYMLNQQTLIKSNTYLREYIREYMFLFQC